MIKHTPGPWGWAGGYKHGNTPYLATTHSGRQFVMGFCRHGFSGAKPVFRAGNRLVNSEDLAIYEVCPEATSPDDPRVYRYDIIGFRSHDAALIAAAPELYEALKLLIADFGDYPAYKRPFHAFDVARAAIAKAEGR
jgi:hypothetical protein